MKRCKGCVFWQPYVGEVKSEAMRRMMNLQAPRRSSRACLLRLHEVEPAEKDGEEPKYRVSFNPADQEGPNYGRRVSPHFHCEHHTAKRPPVRCQRVQTIELPERAVDTQQMTGAAELETIIAS